MVSRSIDLQEKKGIIGNMANQFINSGKGVTKIQPMPKTDFEDTKDQDATKEQKMVGFIKKINLDSEYDRTSRDEDKQDFHGPLTPV
jgi:hypothetical protein|tara:strand:- start:986 stop:1246 length:261 start_codon:yes stop_codon:yes gene_type:complete